MPDINVSRETHIRISDKLVPNGVYPVYSSFEIPEPEYMVEYTSGIESGSMSINQILVDNKIKFGKLTAAKFEVRLHLDDPTDITGKEITVWQVENPGEETENIVYLFDGFIYSAKQNKSDYYKDIIAYDKAYVLSQTDVTVWWDDYCERFQNDALSNAIHCLCWYFGIDLSPTDMNPITTALFNFPNHGNLVKTDKMRFSKISFTSLLEYLLAPLGVIPYISPTFTSRYYKQNETKIYVYGIAELRLFSFSDSVLDVRDVIEVNHSEFSDNIATIPAGIKFLNEDGTVLSYVHSLTDAVTFSYNPILTGIDIRDTDQLALRCFNQLNNVSNYKPAKIKMIVSDLSIPIGSLLRVTDNDYTYNFETTLSGPLLIEQEFDSSSEETPFQSELQDNSLNSDVEVIDTTTPSIAELQAEVEALNSEVLSINSDLLDIGNNISDMQDDIAEDHSDIMSHQGQIGTLFETTAAIQDDVSAAQDDISELQSGTWSALELEQNVEAGTIGGSSSVKIRRVGDRVDIIGSVKVTWDGSSAILVTTVPDNYVGGGYQLTWLATGARASNKIVTALVTIASTGTAKGKLRIIAIQDSTGANITAQQEIVLSTSYYIS